MASISLVPNPFEPYKREQYIEGTDVTIRGWLRSHFGDSFTEFRLPTVCTVNGEPVLRREWDRRVLGARDVVEFITHPAGLTPIQWAWVAIAVLSAATAVIALNAPKVPESTANEREGDPVYTLRGQRNQLKLGDPIEVPYGKNRIFPSYAAATYNQFIDNEQWLYQLFCLGQGRYTIHKMQIEDTPISGDESSGDPEPFAGIEVEVVPPGGSVTLFPDNVVTNAEVDGIELRADNESGSGRVWVEDSPGDPEADPPIAATGHWKDGIAGPYVANPAGTQTNRIELDVSLPRGCYKTLADGTLSELGVTVLFEKRLIDNDGVPLSGWTTLDTWSASRKTVTPQRHTISVDVTPGRYEVRAHRTDTKDEDIRAAHVVQWEGVRAFLPSTVNYGDVTIIAVKAKATNNLNDNSANRFNVICTRKLPVWEESAGWTAPGDEVETRSVVWAFCDIFRSAYGGEIADAFLDMETLFGIDLELTARGEYFDWVFDSDMTVWDAAKVVARVSRGEPMLNGSQVTMVREGIKTVPAAVFNQENIVAGSFDWQAEFATIDEPDGVEVEYTDPVTFQPETVICKRSDEDALNVVRVKLEGCMDRTHAYRWGMWVNSKRRFGREPLSFQTGREGHIPLYKDYCLLSHDTVNYGEGGMVAAIDKVALGGGQFNYVFHLEQPVTFGVGTHKIYLRGRVGDGIGPYTVLETNPTTVYISNTTALAQLDDLIAVSFDGKNERPIFNFGVAGQEGKYFTITNLSPNDDSTVGVNGINYDDRYFDGDEMDPPEKGETEGSLSNTDKNPVVRSLLVTRSEKVTNEAVASWHPARSARYYILEMSYDGLAWTRLAETDKTTWGFQVLPEFIYVRVAAVNEGQGPWKYWTGDAPVEDSFPVAPPTGVTLESDGDTVLLQEDGTVLPRIKVTWTASTDPLVSSRGRYRIQYKRSADGTWLEWAVISGDRLLDYILDVQIGTKYQVRVRAETSPGGISDWAYPAGANDGEIEVGGDTTPPNTMSAPVVTAYPGFIKVAWEPSTAVDIWEYRIYRSEGSDSPTSAVLVGETGGTDFLDPNVVSGTEYWYYVVPVDGSENEGDLSPGDSAEGLPPPASGAVPDSPTAATRETPGADDTYLSGDGTAFGFVKMEVPGMPANALWQNLLYRKDGSEQWTIAAQLKNTTLVTVRVDDLTIGVAYDFATQAFSAAGGSAVVEAVGTPYTVQRGNTPNPPTAATVQGPADTNIPLATQGETNRVVMLGVAILWNNPVDCPDFSHTELKVVSGLWDVSTQQAQITADVTYTWYLSGNDDGLYGIIGKPGMRMAAHVYNATPINGYAYIRTVTRTGRTSAWVYAGSMASVAGASGGTAAAVDVEDLVNTPSVPNLVPEDSSNTDNEPTLQERLDAVGEAGGGMVQLPPGTFLTSTLEITYPNVTLYSTGGSVLKSTSANAPVIRIMASNSGVDNVEFDGVWDGENVAGDFGIIQIESPSSTPVVGGFVHNCRVRKGLVAGIWMVGMLEDTDLIFNDIQQVFVGIASNTSTHGIPVRTRVRNNRVSGVIYQELDNYQGEFAVAPDPSGYSEGDTYYNTAWYRWYVKASGVWAETFSPYRYSAGIKFSRNSGLNAMSGHGHLVTGNIVYSMGEMAIELWGGSSHDAIVSNNSTKDTQWGISINAGNRVVVSGNKTQNNTVIGIELAEGCQHCVVTGNVIYQYNSNGDPLVFPGIQCSGGDHGRNSITSNVITGCSGRAIHLVGGSYYSIVGNQINDCGTGVYLQTAQYTQVRSNYLHCTNGHIWIDCDTGGAAATFSGFIICGNTFAGDSAYANISIYDGNPTRGCTIKNITIIENDFSMASTENYPINTHFVAEDKMVNFIVERNHWNPEGTKVHAHASLDTWDPYLVSSFKHGLAYAKKGIITVETDNTNTRWFKIYALESGAPLRLRVGLSYSIGGIQNDLLFEVYGNPYGTESAIIRHPTGYYAGAPVVSELIYNNPSGGAAHEVWVKVRPINASGTITFWISDGPEYLINDPTPVTTEPTWHTANVQKSSAYIAHSMMDMVGIHCQKMVACGEYAALQWEPKARLWMRGRQPWGSQPPMVARFEDDDGNVLFQVHEDTGVVEMGNAWMGKAFIGSSYSDPGANNLGVQGDIGAGGTISAPSFNVTV